jgi:hypothetical protein
MQVSAHPPRMQNRLSGIPVGKRNDAGHCPVIALVNFWYSADAA